MLGLIARVGGPCSVLDLDSRHYLAFIEGVAREDHDIAAQIDEIYDESKPKPPPPKLSREERNEQLERLQRLFR